MAVVSLVLPDNEQDLDVLQVNAKELLDPLGGICVFPGESVLLYLGYIWPAVPSLGVNPRPSLLAALLELALAEGAGQVGVAAVAAPGFSFRQSWEIAGYGELSRYNISCYDLADCDKNWRESKLNLACDKVPVAEPLLKADYLINVGKFRAAEGKMFGSGMHNLAAAAELPGQEDYPEIFSRSLVDLYSIISPDLHVLDALKGESGYQLQRRHALFAAYDAVALDATLAALAGLTVGKIDHLALAGGYGLGVANASDIRLVGDDALELFGY